MPAELATEIQRTRNGRIRIALSRGELERFCNSFRFFRKGLLQHLRAAEKDHRAGRVTKRDSLFEPARD